MQVLFMSKKKNDNINIEIQFRSIEILDVNIALQTIHNTNIFTFDISTEIQLNKDNKFIIVIIGIKISNESKEVEFGGLKVSNVFYIGNYEQVVTEDKHGRVSLPESFTVMVNSISLSTTRGVMWNTFKGTMLHNAILPILDPKPTSL